MRTTNRKAKQMSEVHTTTVKESTSGNSYEGSLNVPTTMAEAGEMWGEEVCLSLLNAKAVIQFQDLVRRNLKLGKTDEEIAEAIADFKPTKGRKGGPRKSFVAKSKENFKKMSPEERQAYLAELQASLDEEE